MAAGEFSQFVRYCGAARGDAWVMFCAPGEAVLAR